MSDSSFYIDNDFEFSQEDLLGLDEDANRAYELREIGELQAWLLDVPEAALSIALDETEFELDGEPANTNTPAPVVASRHGRTVSPTPYEKYRQRRDALSVTDITSLAWCEVQFDYGLRQMRNRKLEARPTSFVSAAGKTITLTSAGKDLAASNDVVLQKGRSVHKILEQEIRPVEVHVDVATDEERWALRLVTMISCLDDLELERRCREMPVFGIIHDQVITGIIDEITIKLVEEDPPLSTIGKRPADAIHHTPRKGRESKRSKQAPSSSPSSSECLSQTALTAFFPVTPTKGTRKEDIDPGAPGRVTDAQLSTSETRTDVGPRHTLYLSDTKTRRSPSLPGDEDALSSRLQLMLYNHLLKHCITSFDFSTFWTRVGVDRTRQFSLRFQEQTGLLLFSGTNDSNSRAHVNTLAGLEQLWERRIREVNICGVSPDMTLVYRTQPTSLSRKRASKKNKPSRAASSIARGEHAKLEEAIRESLTDVDLDHDDALVHILATKADSVPLNDADEADHLAHLRREDGSVPTPLREDPELAWAVQQSLLPVVTAEEGCSASSASLTNSDAELNNANSHSSVVIGCKPAVMDDDFLDHHLTRALDWWHGRRPAEGVPVERSHRCFTCEYCEGCEWREKKAEEALKKSRDGRSQTKKIEQDVPRDDPLSW